jgi:hypothetical protein
MKYEATGAKIGALVDQKNRKYGDSFVKSGEIIRIFFPKGIEPSQYDDLLALIRVLDKMFRIATDKTAFGESPWQDIAGYGILKATQDAEERDEGGM